MSSLEWSRPFYRCSACGAIWSITFNPKDLIYEQSATPKGMKQALSADASIEDLLEPLFAWAPVDEMTERGLWELEYEPQVLFDRLVEIWGDESVEVNRRSDMLRQFRRLLSGNNPHHRRLQKERGWIIENSWDFSSDLAADAGAINGGDPTWRAYHRYAPEDLSHVLRLLTKPGVVQGISPPLPEAVPERSIGVGVAASPTADAAEMDRQPPVDVPEIPRLQSLLQPYWRFLPAIVVGMFLVRPGLAGAPGFNPYATGFFGLVTVLLTGVAVMCNSGLSEGGYLLTLYRRCSALAEYLLVVSLMVMWLGVSMAVALSLELGQAALFCLILVGWLGLALRLWPMLVVPFLQPLEADVKMGRMPKRWIRTGITTAWKLTRGTDTLVRFSLPWLGASLAASAFVAGLHQLLGLNMTVLVASAVILPVWWAWTWRLGSRLED